MFQQFHTFNSSWTCSIKEFFSWQWPFLLNTEEDQPTTVQLYIIIYLIDYYSFRACFPNENNPTTNIDVWSTTVALIGCDTTLIIYRISGSCMLSTKRQYQPPTKTNPLKRPKWQQKGPQGGKTWSAITCSTQQFVDHQASKTEIPPNLNSIQQVKLNFFQTSTAECKHCPPAPAQKTPSVSAIDSRQPCPLPAALKRHSVQEHNILDRNVLFLLSKSPDYSVIRKYSSALILRHLYKCSHAQWAVITRVL